MPDFSQKSNLRKRVEQVLYTQGFTVNHNTFSFPSKNLEEQRAIHTLSRAERINQHYNFIRTHSKEAERYLLNSWDIEIEKIDPILIEVKSSSSLNNLFRWWNLTWWSLPYERSYGRQMRFVVWDRYHDALIGLIGLQSPILSWSVRDNYLGLNRSNKDFWVNQSLNAQRLGALPPYNKLLGGKLVSYLVASDTIRNRFRAKYKDYETLLLGRHIPARLLFVTTTGAYGKSSIYNRLSYQKESVCKFIGYTQGSGSFHIPNSLYEYFVTYLREHGHEAGRGFGNGPSAKMRIINDTMKLLGFKKGSSHGIRRGVYLFPLAKNLENVLKYGKRPLWHHRSVKDLTEHWKTRWACKRTNCPEKTFFNKEQYFNELLCELENCRTLVDQADEHTFHHTA